MIWRKKELLLENVMDANRLFMEGRTKRAFDLLTYVVTQLINEVYDLQMEAKPKEEKQA